MSVTVSTPEKLTSKVAPVGGHQVKWIVRLAQREVASAEYASNAIKNLTITF